MTTAEELVADKAQKVHDLVEAHPEYDDDTEVGDINDVEERINFIVPQTDDPSTPAFTVRSVVLGTIFCVLLSFINTLLTFRSNAFAIGANIAVILAYPIGLAWAALLPKGNIINPGPFTMKEHVLIFVMASCTGLPYGLDNVVVQAMPQLMGNESITFIQSWAFVFVTQFIGYGMSGLCRRFLVKPTAMWWPGSLTTIALMSSFHKVETGDAAGNRFKLSRFTVFWIAFGCMFTYAWLPEYFAPGLQAVSIMCLIAGSGKSNPAGVMTKFNAIAGSTSNGVGLLGMAFDWAYIGSTYLTSPFWASAVYLLGNIFFSWILTPIFYAQDIWGINAKISEDDVTHNPFLNSAHLFVGNPDSVSHEQGSRVRPTFFYNVSDNYNLNLTAYNDVAPVYITGFFAICYGTSFLAITASLAHVFVWYGKDIYRQTMNAFRQVRDEVDAQDKHVKMMEAYPDIPDWAYLAFLGVITIAAVAVSLWTPYNMPWWAIFFNLLLCAIFIVPFGIIQAISGFGLGLNVLTEFVIGLMIPGQTVAVMAFKSWGTNNLIQALALTQDLKLGQYLHIPPYAMVFAQFWGTFVNSIVATAVAYFMMFNSGNLLEQPEWQYYNYQIFYSAGGIWGAIGPQRFFGIGSLYEGLLWCFLIGAITPLLPWLGNKYVVKSKYWHYINFPLIYSMWGPGGYQSLYTLPFIIAYFGQVYMFRHQKEFYQKYMYVIGVAFDASSALAITFISVLGIYGYSFTTRWALNPNTDVLPNELTIWTSTAITTLPRG
ncbi:OPT oligopeptide transporter protein-domain-containing protein [Obelidium mucronatum]|nr:OPT oligopeptide transporter protein-domain-containing protein [Obelidium mucronatum]